MKYSSNAPSILIHTVSLLAALFMTRSVIADDTPELRMTPLIHRTIPDDGDPERQFVFDLDTGKLMAAPIEALRGGPAEAFEWMRTSGVDVMCEGGNKGLVGIDLIAMQVMIQLRPDFRIRPGSNFHVRCNFCPTWASPALRYK